MRILSLLTLIVYALVNMLSPCPQLLAQEPIIASWNLLDALIPLDIPKNFGRIEYYHQGVAPPSLVPGHRSPIIVHIQSAHGNYEAEKNIQAILHYLNKNYGFDTLFLEGGVGKLQPELFNLFPARPDLNLKVADQLAKKAGMSGPELFLIEKMHQGAGETPGPWSLSADNVEAYGIEDAEIYRKNRKAFQKVLRQDEKAKKFLQSLNIRIKSLGGPHLNDRLRVFLRNLEAYETQRMDLLAFGSFLKKEAKWTLDIELEDPFYQKARPMLTRFFRLEQIRSKLDQKEIQEERSAFLRQIQSYSVDHELFKKVQASLGFPFERAKIEIDGAGLPSIRSLFEELLKYLPRDFDFRALPHLKLHIQGLILASEIESDALFAEIHHLKDQLLEHLSSTQAEKEMILLYRAYYLLEKLFYLKLTREDYKNMTYLSESQSLFDLKPSSMAQRFLQINGKARRVKDTQFAHLEEMDRFYELALSFYRGAYERDHVMQRNIVRRIRALGKSGAIVVTGGFHSEGLKQYLQSAGFSYALVTPRLTQIPEDDPYRLAMLETVKFPFKTSQIADALTLQSVDDWVSEGVNPYYRRNRLIQAFHDSRIEPQAFRVHNSTLFGSQFGLAVDRKKIMDEFSTSLPLRFLPIQAGEPKLITARAEVRSAAQELERLEREIQSDPAHATEPNLKKVLSFLRHENSNIQQIALKILPYLLWPDLPLETLNAYRKSIAGILLEYRRDIESVLWSQHSIVKTINTMSEKGHPVSLERLIGLNAKISNRNYEEEMLSSTADVSSLSQWIWKLRQGSQYPQQWVQLILDYDTGTLPSQADRAKFIALYLFITSINHADFSPMDLVTHPKKPGVEYGFIRRYPNQIGYFFQLPREMREGNLAVLLREIQFLHLGMILASAQESFSTFFPEENPGWMDAKMNAVAQTYRAFERLFVLSLRAYNQHLKNARDIYLLEGENAEEQRRFAQYQVEMQKAFGNYRLEESLFPNMPWFDSPASSQYAWNSLVSMLRAVEGMVSHQGEGRRKSERENVTRTIGLEFVEDIRQAGYRIFQVFEHLISSKDEVVSPDSPEFKDLLRETALARVFEEGGKFMDPFIQIFKVDKKDDPIQQWVAAKRLEDTQYYLQKNADALSKKNVFLPQLPDPERYKGGVMLYKIEPASASRSELRNNGLAERDKKAAQAFRNHYRPDMFAETLKEDFENFIKKASQAESEAQPWLSVSNLSSLLTSTPTNPPVIQILEYFGIDPYELKPAEFREIVEYAATLSVHEEVAEPFFEKARVLETHQNWIGAWTQYYIAYVTGGPQTKLRAERESERVRNRWLTGLAEMGIKGRTDNGEVRLGDIAANMDVMTARDRLKVGKLFFQFDLRNIGFVHAAVFHESSAVLLSFDINGRPVGINGWMTPNLFYDMDRFEISRESNDSGMIDILVQGMKQGVAVEEWRIHPPKGDSPLSHSRNSIEDRNQKLASLSLSPHEQKLVSDLAIFIKRKKISVEAVADVVEALGQDLEIQSKGGSPDQYSLQLRLKTEKGKAASEIILPFIQSYFSIPFILWRQFNINPRYRVIVGEVLKELTKGEPRSLPRAESRGVQKDLELIAGIQRTVLNDPRNATKESLQIILEILKSAGAGEEEGGGVEDAALQAIVHLVAENPALRKNLPDYRKNITDALMRQSVFVQYLAEAKGNNVQLENLVNLKTQIFDSVEGDKWGPQAADISGLSTWLSQTKGKDSVFYKWIQVLTNFDSGRFSFERERGRFIALFLFVANTFFEDFRPLKLALKDKGSHSGYGLFHRYDPAARKPQSFSIGRTSYFFRLSNQLNESNIRIVLRQVQLLHLGMLLASAEERFKFFFPNENPPWMDARMQAISQMYRAFERLFVRLLRNYNPYLYTPEEDIFLLEGADSTDEKEKQIYHAEMIAAFKQHHLEEILYPDNDWLDAPDRLRLRVVEGMRLNIRSGKRKAGREGRFTVGQDFSDEVKDLGLRIFEVLETLVSEPDVDNFVRSEKFESFLKDRGVLEVFKEVFQRYDPFMDDRKFSDTVYYVSKINLALRNHKGFFAKLPEPEQFKGIFQRAEIRTGVKDRIKTLLEKRESLWKHVDAPRTIYGQANQHVEVIEGAVRMFAIGDVHGDLRGLVKLLAAAYGLSESDDGKIQQWIGGLKEKDYENRKLVYKNIIEMLDIEKGDVIAFAGDFVDRGEQSAEAVEFIINLKEHAKQVDSAHSPQGGARVVTIMGNHDYAFRTLFQELESRFFNGEGTDLEAAEKIAHVTGVDRGTVNEFYEKNYYSYEEIRNSGVVDFFLKDLKQLVAIDDNVLAHANIPQLSGVKNLQALEESYERMLIEEGKLNKMSTQRPETNRELMIDAPEKLISNTWGYISDWGLPHYEHQEESDTTNVRQRRETDIHKQKLNRERLYEMIGQQPGVKVKPSRLLVGHDPSLKSVDRVSYPLTDDVYHLDGGLAPYYRGKGTTPGILEFNAAGYIGVHQPFGAAKNQKWKVIFRAEELPELVLSSQNAEAARKVGIPRVNAELKQLRTTADSQGEDLAQQELGEGGVDPLKSSVSPFNSNTGRRSEMRYLGAAINEISDENALSVVQKISDGIIGVSPAQFDRLFLLFFRDRIRSVQKTLALDNLASNRLSWLEKEVGVFDERLLRKVLSAKDDRFGLVPISVSAELNSTTFLRVLKEFQPVLKNHPGKVLVLSYGGKLSDAFMEEMYEKYDKRIFIFQGETAAVLKALYSGNIAHLEGKQNQKWAKRFYPRVAELNAGKATPAILSESSLVVGSESLFKEFAIPISKQFVEKNLEGFSAEDLFRAHLLFALPYASLTQAELIKEIQENVPELETKNDGDSIRLSFKTDRAQSILNLVRAAQKILQAA